MTIQTTHPRTRSQRGAVLITAMWIAIALVAVVLVLAREISVESKATAQHLALAKVDAGELGIEQFIVASVASELTTPGTIDNVNFEQMQLGDCYVWVIRPSSDDETIPEYGLTDEGGKIDLNTATPYQLQLLPNITDELVASIFLWRGGDPTTYGSIDFSNGGDDSYYMALDTPYHLKGAPFESIDELKLVRGATDDLLYGADLNHNGTLEPTEQAQENTGMSFDTSALGIIPCVTVFGTKANTVPPASSSTSTTGTTGTTQTGDVNTGQNLQTVLQQYLPGKAQQIIQQMPSSVNTGRPGGAGGAGGGVAITSIAYKSIWDWAVQMNLSSSDMSQLWDSTNQRFMVTASQTTTTTGGARGGVGSAATTSNATPAKINIMSATLPALQAIATQTAALSQSDAQAIVSYRENTTVDPTQKGNISWVLDVVDKATLSAVGGLITGTTSVYSADIVTVTRDGRAFKRVKIIVDASTGTPQIIFRQDLTSQGWPLDPTIREALRSGKGIDQLGGNRAASNNGLSSGLH
jgi:DNA uptake protein ComE-like DNA-binding protein